LSQDLTIPVTPSERHGPAVRTELATPSLLSILIPLYNEEEFIGELLTRVLNAPLPQGMERELIVVDDASNDGSLEIAEQFSQRYPGIVRLVRHSRNQGKGAAIRTAVEHATGEFCIIQDSDLEYDPREYINVLKPLLEGAADAVYGSRFRSNRFGIEPEITIKLAQRQARIYETPITYHGRTYEEGKKIGFKDALQAFYVILKTGLTRDIYKNSGPETLEALAAAPRFNQWMADTIRPFVGDSVMEIGAGIGNLTRCLVPRTNRYVVTDIDPEHLARLASRFQHRPNVQIRFADLSRAENFKEFTGQIDSVVCLNVLEHIEDDLAGLRNIHSALCSGGRAIVLVPHGQEIFGTLDAALGHYRRYSEPELRNRMEQTGFQVEQVIMFNRISRPAWYISGKVFRRTNLGRRQMRLFDRFVWLWRRIDRGLPWPSISLIAIGVKK
jgi:SAM-dependent methyltransferase